MGRHTKLGEADAADDASPAQEPSAHVKWITKVPLLPAVAGLVAVGICAAAWSTSQISLNFAGGGSAHAQSGRQGGGVQDSAAQRDGAGGGTGGTTKSQARTGVLIAFKATSRTATGFTATATIANHTDETIDRWALAFKIPNAKVLTATNAVLVRPGATVAFMRSPASTALRPGQSVRITFTARGSAAKPSACKFNRATCTLV